MYRVTTRRMSYANLSDLNAEYTVRDLFAQTMGLEG